MKLCKKVFSLILVLLVAAALPLSAAADAWIPPDDGVNYTILGMPYNNGDCHALNAFVSNYVEANMTSYDANTPDSTAVAVVLKHFELNPGLYPNDVSSFYTEEDGRNYMKISAGCFERKMSQLFRRSISASACEGYENGYIVVSADNYGNTIQVLGTVESCDYLGDGMYSLRFDVFYVPSGVTGLYGVCHYDMSQAGYTVIGSGYATFYFGDSAKTSFYSSDFQLLSFSMNAQGIPASNANEPMPQPTEPPATTEAATEPAAETQPTELPTEAPTQAEEEPPIMEPGETTPASTEPVQGGGSRTMVILIVILVVAVALLSLAVILLLFKVTKK